MTTAVGTMNCASSQRTEGSPLPPTQEGEEVTILLKRAPKSGRLCGKLKGGGRDIDYIVSEEDLLSRQVSHNGEGEVWRCEIVGTMLGRLRRDGDSNGCTYDMLEVKLVERVEVKKTA